jgi:chemotaxis protein methyltransferase CheR
MRVPTVLYSSARFLARRVPYLGKFKDQPAWRILRHWVALMVDPRTNSTFTGFFRLPSQFEALTGPVISFLTRERPTSRLRVVTIGCSNGAEAYSIASMLMVRRPHVEFQVDGYDINADMCEKARCARYDESEVLNNQMLTAEFMQATFDVGNDVYRVKANIAARTRFHVADALSPGLERQVGQCDILFAQNFLFHLDRKAAVRAFENLCSLLKPRAALFIDGMDIDLRRKCTRLQRLIPLDFRIEEIHNEARRARGVGWPYSYWGLEPFMTFAGDWRRRYATIFLKDDGEISRASSWPRS